MEVVDEGEPIEEFSPLMVSEDSPQRGELNDLALELARALGVFQASLPEFIIEGVVGLVRSVNCYYSNLIEGHNTHPIDIERALRDEYNEDPEKRNLQLEAKAHIAVQKWIDEGGLRGHPFITGNILEIHRRFYALMPPDLCHVENPDTGERVQVQPGALRDRLVQVGRHVPVSPGAVPRFLKQLEVIYGRPGQIERILACACAHHRLLWVHPFLDGNGRVARLMSYAMLRQELNAAGLWSIARGLARDKEEYKSHMQSCDRPRLGDRDGRGKLSESALAFFTRFFLECCIDQVNFMEGLIKPDHLMKRALAWAEEEMAAGTLPAKSDVVLKAIFTQGELRRADAVSISGVSERSTDRIISALTRSGALASANSRAPLRLGFSAKLAKSWMPGLFPKQ